VKPWIGPFRINSVLSPKKFLITDFEGKIQPVVVALEEIKPYILRLHQGTAQQLIESVDQATAFIKSIGKSKGSNSGTKTKAV